MIDVDKIIKAYSRAKGVNAEMAFLERGADTYADAQRYAILTGDVVERVFGTNIDLSSIDAAEAAEAMNKVFQKPFNDLSRVINNVQYHINQDAGIGLKPLVPNFSQERIGFLVDEITKSDVTRDFIKNEITNYFMKSVDEAVAMNMEAHSNAGLETYIRRTYDDVGVHNRKEPCEWCLERAGEWTDYDEAYAAGVFERHPGCACEIEYKVGRTHTRATSASNWVNV